MMRGREGRGVFVCVEMGRGTAEFLSHGQFTIGQYFFIHIKHFVVFTDTIYEQLNHE